MIIYGVSTWDLPKENVCCLKLYIVIIFTVWTFLSLTIHLIITPTFESF